MRFQTTCLCLLISPLLSSQINSGKVIQTEPLAVGRYHSLFIRNGMLYAAGQNVYGQLGNQNKADAPMPVKAGTATNYVSVSTRAYTSLALKSDGSLWAWGFNNYGEVGNGNRVHQFNPVSIGRDTNWVSVSAGDAVSFAIKRNGSLWGWGNNTMRLLGVPLPADISMFPIQLGKELSWQMVAAGINYTLALKKDGSLWGWGANGWGMLGTGNVQAQTSPVQIGTETNWLFVTAGQFHSFAIKTDCSLWAWGNNQNGELGIGSLAKQLSPVAVGKDKWKAISCGQRHSVGIKQDGTLWAWGSGSSLGIGNTGNKNTPQQIGRENNWVSVAAGNAQSLAMKADGSLFAWGSNSYGELGIGNTTGQLIPVAVK